MSLPATPLPAIYAGSFDPVTRGHGDIIRRAARLFSPLHICVAENDGKTPLFSTPERMAMLEEEIAPIKLGESEIHLHALSELLIHFARKLNVNIIVRGLRAVSDFDYEFQMVGMNRAMAHDIETVFFMADETTHFVSSKLVKEIARMRGDVSPFVSDIVRANLERKLSV